MAIPEIPLLPDAPTPSDTQEQFDAKAFPMVAAWNPTITKINESVEYVNQRAEAAEEAASTLEDPAVQTVVQNISAIVAVNNNKTNIDAVAANKSNIDNVAGNESNIDTVASSKSNINTVAARADDVETVADNIGDVIAVADNKTNIDAVAANATNIDAVADNATNIDAVAGNASNINTVAASKDNIDTVAADTAPIGTVAGISTQVQAVANIDDDVAAVAGNAANINTVADNKPNIDAVAGNVVAVGIVATDIDAVTAAAAAMDAILAAPGAASSAANSAGDAAGAASNAADSAAAAAQSAQEAADIVLGQVFDDDAVSAAFGWTSQKIDAQLSGKSGAVTLSGPVNVGVAATATYTITNYNSFSVYSVAASAGAASITDDEISFTAPESMETVTLTVTVDGVDAQFSIYINDLEKYIPIPKPTPANYCAPFEGGFYMGLIWNELIQSATGTTIGTGEKVFSVPTMTQPITYVGHQIEIRSRANPENKMVGEVMSADIASKTITVNVTSINGSGAFDDWSIMSRYRIIVAPKSGGENSSVRIKNANTELPTACQTVTEGWQATMSMVGEGDATMYPAAHWARGLSINGFSDFYVPARDELELCWRNAKPVTNNNATSRVGSAIFDYQNRGSYGDVNADHGGLNLNSDPPGARYTTTIPAQTPTAAFRAGGAEAFEFGSEYYRTSSDYHVTGGWIQNWTAGSPGGQTSSNKSSLWRIRAVRRSII